MSKDSAISRVLNSGVVAILRAPSGEMLADVAAALCAGGVEAIEVTFTVPSAHRVLEQVVSRLGDKILLGAGTVLDPETARIALLSGAEFIVCPTVNPEVIRLCRRYDKVVMPGALTPTEVLTAWELGADIVKVFPSDFTGPAYLKALHGPLPQIRLMPTGGVNLQTAADFLRAGACALGVGSALVDPKAVAARDTARIESLGRQYVEIVRKTREEMKNRSR
jgi:2-dehydro-3-deoxyphosphogluconate aldolase / (4S)-4-hydroxy-2-oxoglutarate aldolase